MKILIILLGIISLAACNKVKQTTKKIVGQFDISQYTYENHQGLKYIYDCNGTVNLNSTSEENQLSILVDVNCNGIHPSPNMTGLIVFKNDGEYFLLNRNNLDGTISNFDNGRVILRTKTDLKIEYFMESGKYIFVLRKR